MLFSFLNYQEKLNGNLVCVQYFHPSQQKITNKAVSGLAVVGTEWLSFCENTKEEVSQKWEQYNMNHLTLGLLKYLRADPSDNYGVTAK